MFVSLNQSHFHHWLVWVPASGDGSTVVQVRSLPPADQALLMAFEVRASLFGSDDPGVVDLWRRFQERVAARTNVEVGT